MKLGSPFLAKPYLRNQIAPQAKARPIVFSIVIASPKNTLAPTVTPIGTRMNEMGSIFEISHSPSFDPETNR